MSQPVRVGLVFPRSGQQVFVHVPLHKLEPVEAQPFDQKLHSADVLLRATGHGSAKTNGNGAHA